MSQIESLQIGTVVQHLAVGIVKYDRRAREAGESKYTVKKMLKLAAKGFACGRLKPRSTMRPALDPYIGEVLHE